MRRLIRAASIVALSVFAAAPALAGQSQQGPGNATTRQLQRFKKLDTDGNGSISRLEWTRKAKAFDRLDANKDGMITPAELRAARARRAHRA